MLTVNGNDRRTLILQVSNQSSPIIYEIGREVKQRIEVNIEVLKKKKLSQAEEVIHTTSSQQNLPMHNSYYGSTV